MTSTASLNQNPWVHQSAKPVQPVLPAQQPRPQVAPQLPLAAVEAAHRQATAQQAGLTMVATPIVLLPNQLLGTVPKLGVLVWAAILPVFYLQLRTATSVLLPTPSHFGLVPVMPQRREPGHGMMEAPGGSQVNFDLFPLSACCGSKRLYSRKA